MLNMFTFLHIQLPHPPPPPLMELGALKDKYELMRVIGKKISLYITKRTFDLI